MTTTPTLWLSALQANIIDDPGAFGTATNEQSNARVVGLTGGRFLVAWEDFSTVQGGLEPPDITGRIFDAFGAPVGGQIYLSAAYSDLTQRLPDIAALPNGGFIAAYQTTDAAGANDLENIDVAVFDAAGNRIRDDDFRQGFGGPAGVNDTNPTVTSFADNSYVLFYSSDASGTADLVGHIVSSAGVKGAAFMVDGDAGVTSAADSARLSNGNVVVAYQHAVGGNDNVRFSIRTAAGALVVGGPVAETPNAETAPAVAALTGGFVVVWEEANGNGAGVAGLGAKVFSNAGVGGVSLDSSTFAPVATAQTKPTVTALDDGGFVLGWLDVASGDAKGIRFNAAGSTVGAVFTVPDFNTADGPSFALLDDGRLVAALTNTDGTGDKDILVSIHDPRTSPINGTANGETLTSRIDGASVFGLGGEDKLYGFAGIDRLDGGGGHDEMTGGGGNDLFFVDSTGDKTFEAGGGGGGDQVVTTVSYTLMSGQEIEIFTPTSLTGTNAIDLTGNEFANRIGGNNGVNRIDGGVGADNMFGYAGNDFYTVDNAGDRVNEAVGGGGLDMVVTKIDYTLTAGQEIEILTPVSITSNHAINLTGNEFANRIGGNNGVNRIDGGVGADNMFGYAGNDFYTVDNAGDRVNEAVGGGALDMVVTKIDYTLTAGQEIEILTPVSIASNHAINLTGNEFANRIGGNNGVNHIDGGGGGDALFGYAGDDVFVFRQGQANGDTVYDFAGNGIAAGDKFEFVGYGAGASFAALDATHWRITYNAGASHETITIANGAAIDASDYGFI